MDALPPSAHAEPPLPSAPERETGESHVHVVPLRVLVAVWLTLLVLTVMTVGATHWNFGGSVNLWIAMGIATVKASFVALYFMHLRYDNPFHGIVLVTALLFVMLFIGLALIDTQQYHPTLIPDYAPLINP